MHLLGLNPSQIADAISGHFPVPEHLALVDQSQGCINFRLAESWLQRQVDMILQGGAISGHAERRAARRVQIECISANPTGPLTVGRIRGGIIGDTLARLFHPIHEEIPALRDDVPHDLAQARLKLYAAAKIVLGQVLDLTSMSAPETM